MSFLFTFSPLLLKLYRWVFSQIMIIVPSLRSETGWSSLVTWQCQFCWDWELYRSSWVLKRYAPSGATSVRIHPCGDPSIWETSVTHVSCTIILRKCACMLLIVVVVVWSISVLRILVRMSFLIISHRGNALLMIHHQYRMFDLCFHFTRFL